MRRILLIGPLLLAAQLATAQHEHHRPGMPLAHDRPLAGSHAYAPGAPMDRHASGTFEPMDHRRVPRSSLLPMRRILVLAQLLPFVLCAQEPLMDVMNDHGYFGPARYANAQDSADFALFRQGLTTDTTSKAGPPTSYRMVWREHQQGGYWSISRGEGSLTLPPNEDVSVHGVLDRTPFRTADGRRGLMIWHEWPCALIRRSAMYYVEETGGAGRDAGDR